MKKVLKMSMILNKHEKMFLKPYTVCVHSLLILDHLIQGRWLQFILLSTVFFGHLGLF